MSKEPLENLSQSNKRLSYRLGRSAMIGFSKLLLVPGARKLFNRSFLGACSYVNHLTGKGKSRLALTHLLKLLESGRFKNKQAHQWWHLMRQAISIAQDTQLDGQPPPNDEIRRLIELAQVAPQPAVGYDAAYCFIGLGLWAFQMGDSAQAISRVQQAIDADNEWGYPEYLMGWLALFQENMDPIPHFVRALKFNWSFFHRINKDPICQQHPDVIRQVRQQVLKTSTAASISP